MIIHDFKWTDVVYFFKMCILHIYTKVDMNALTLLDLKSTFVFQQKDDPAVILLFSFL